MGESNLVGFRIAGSTTSAGAGNESWGSLVTPAVPETRLNTLGFHVVGNCGSPPYVSIE